MDILTLISVIITIVGGGVTVFALRNDYNKSQANKRDIKLFLENKDLRPFISWAQQNDIKTAFYELLNKLICSSSVCQKEYGDFVLLQKDNDSVGFISVGYSIWGNILSIPSYELLLSKLSEMDRIMNEIECDNVTYVLVVPLLVKEKEDWNKRLNKTHKNSVVIYDARDLIIWLKNDQQTYIWFDLKYLKSNSSEDMILAEDFWEEWITGPEFNLNEKIIIGGRDKEVKLVQNVATNPSIICIQSSSRDESLAFIVASLIENNSNISNCIIVDSSNSFKKLIKRKEKLLLIPRFEDNSVLNLAVSLGHSVIIPIGLENVININSIIVLPPIDRNIFEKELKIILGCKKVGKEEQEKQEERAKKFSKESARNIIILRRQLGFSRNIPRWANLDCVREIIPAMIIGKWNNDSKRDKELVSMLAGKSYDEYISELSKWLYISDSPIIKIGNSWRIVSPLDVWTNISQYIQKKDINNLKEAFLKAFSQKNTKLNFPAKERIFIDDSEDKYSSWIKEGLAQSLVLVAIYGDKLYVAIDYSSQIWVDKIISELLKSNDELLWKSFEDYLITIAEASPDSFLSSIEKHIKDESVLGCLFEEEEGLLFPSSYHSNLLWALEEIAWMPEYISRAALILAKLSEIDPGGELTNRPINSLNEIFKPWHYQTLASFDDRMNVLRLIANKYKNIGWSLLCNLLPSNNSVGNSTNRMRWRLFEEITIKPITYNEIFKTHSTIVDILLELYDNSESKFAQLIEESASDSLSPEDRNKILDFLDERLMEVKQVEYFAWNKLREILSHHRSYSDADWVLSKDILDRYQNMYNELAPKDDIAKFIWLFEDSYPLLPEGINSKNKSIDYGQKIIQQRRIEVIKEIWKKYGIDKIIDLGLKVKETWALGYALASVIDDKYDSYYKIFEHLKLDIEKQSFVFAFIFKKVQDKGVDWVFDIYNKLIRNNYSELNLSNLFLSLEQNRTLWNRIEKLSSRVYINYWSKVIARFWNLPSEDVEFGLERLKERKRFFTAIDICYMTRNSISTMLIVSILELAATVESAEEVRFNSYHIYKLFQELDKRNDLEKSIYIKLEWYYLQILFSYGNRGPKYIYEEMSKNPDFFIEILSTLYMSKDEEINRKEREIKNLDNEVIVSNTSKVYSLLDKWKIIPGVDNDGQINSSILNNWIKDVRNLAINCSREDVVDMQIGKILAQYPESNNDLWPPKEICDIIERVNTDSLKRNFSIAVFNKRGFSTRGPFDGGDIERRHAKYFEDLSFKHKSKHPNLAKIFNGLAIGYREDAKRRDIEAKRIRLDY